MTTPTNHDPADPSKTAAPDTPAEPDRTTSAEVPSQFEQAATEPELGLVREFLQFLVENKAWWLVPIVLSLILLGAAAWLSGSGLSPFIYPLF
jgi:hypothetical protein